MSRREALDTMATITCHDCHMVFHAADARDCERMLGAHTTTVCRAWEAVRRYSGSWRRVEYRFRGAIEHAGVPHRVIPWPACARGTDEVHWAANCIPPVGNTRRATDKRESITTGVLVQPHLAHFFWSMNRRRIDMHGGSKAQRARVVRAVDEYASAADALTSAYLLGGKAAMFALAASIVRDGMGDTRG